MSSVTATSSIPAFLSAIDYAREGVNRGLRSFDQVAQSIADTGISGGGVSADNLLGLVEARIQVEASLKALRSGERMLGTLLDTRA